MIGERTLCAVIVGAGGVGLWLLIEQLMETVKW